MKKIFQTLMWLGLFLPFVAMAGPETLVLKDLDGKETSVGQYLGKGKWTVVMVWAHNCPICNQEVEDMNFFHDEHKDRDAQVLGISVDGWSGVDKARGFVDLHGVDFPNLITEPRQDVLGQFDGREFVGTPTFYLFTPEGKLAGKQIGPLEPEVVERFIASVKQAREEDRTPVLP